jgi:23S rRNA (cytidine1920-2'-O)/16S rRNA (cytidine1409-2'-O)-methyltransferase
MKKRLDTLLIEKGYYETLEEARSAIMEGLVYTDGFLLTKPGMEYKDNINIYVKSKKHNFVSRGGLKLEKAIKEFNIDLKNKVMLDVGCSTGGFTDVALKNGAKLVYALDVGTNCLSYNLRTDKRVVIMERTNFKESKKEDFESPIDIITIDVSFISLKSLITPIKDILSKDKELTVLIKPQFESLKEEASINEGVILEKEVHERVISEVVDVFDKNDLFIQNLTYSPIKGRRGNMEFLAYFVKEGIKRKIDIKNIVNLAHEKLKSNL